MVGARPPDWLRTFLRPPGRRFSRRRGKTQARQSNFPRRPRNPIRLRCRPQIRKNRPLGKSVESEVTQEIPTPEFLGQNVSHGNEGKETPTVRRYQHLLECLSSSR